MKRLPLVAVMLVMSAWTAAAQDLKLSGSVAYDDREYDSSVTSGVEEKLTLGWQRTFFTPVSLRILFRAEDFRGTNEEVGYKADSHTRQLQPIGELTYAVSDFFLSVRHDYLSNRAETGDVSTRLSNERTSFIASWARERAPSLSIIGQRHHVSQPFRTVDDDTLGATVAYSVSGLQVSGTSQVGRSLDAAAGYERTSTINGALLDWHSTFLQNRVAANVSGTANMASYDQHALNSTDTSVPFPVTIARALYTVDETPADGRDHELVNAPALIDGSLNTPADVSLGPDGVSYQNLVLDIGRIETLDEIRLIVRDDRGNPVKRIGAVSFDVYTSEDGLLWSSVPSAQSHWDVTVSYYSITFDATRSRWFKVVTFGVNPEPVLVTELQAFFHRTLPAGQNRTTNQRLYTGDIGLTVTPVRRLAIRYGGTYNSVSVDDAGSPSRTQNDMLHEIGAEVTLHRGFTTGAFVTQHEVQATALSPESDRTVAAYLRAIPSRRFEGSIDVTRRDSERSFDSSTVETVAFHSKMRLLRSLRLAFDAGQDTVTPHDSGLRNRRQFLNITADAQLYPSLRMLLTVATQQTSVPNAVEEPLLGRRDNRAYMDLTWTPGNVLLLRARYGWLSSENRSAITQQYFVDWNPLEGGSIVIGGSHEEDFDPYTNRRASRTTIRPRWFINDFMTLDINYFLFKSAFGNTTLRQRTLYAALNLTRK